MGGGRAVDGVVLLLVSLLGIELFGTMTLGGWFLYLSGRIEVGDDDDDDDDDGPGAEVS